MGVSQGSILRPLLFNIFLCDVFQFFPDLDITNYADDNIKLNKVLHDLEKNVRYFIQMIHWYLLKVNPEKSHLLANSVQEIQINIGGMAMSNRNCF